MSTHKPQITRKSFAYVIPQLLNNGNQETKHESKYLVETMSELFNINGITEGKFPLSFQTIDCYQQEYPILTKKLKCA